jgi:hypothetical protein
LKRTINIELFRAYGLSAGFLLLLVGKLVSERYVFMPNGTMAKEDTFIYKTFNFNHTCSYLDWNPSRTVSAIIGEILIVPMCIFVVLNYYRLKYEHKVGKISDALWLFCRIQTPFSFTGIVLFFMVFVNHPTDTLSFVAHYVPYMFFQMSILLVAIEQTWYISEKETVPFNIPKPLLRIYLYITVATFIYYTVFIWSFVLEHPILDTTVPWKRNIGISLMYLWDVVAVLIPIIFGFIESKNGQDQTIMFYHNTGEE